MVNMKCSTGIPFTAEIAYLGNRDMKNSVFQKWCSAQNSAKWVLLSMAMMGIRFSAYYVGEGIAFVGDVLCEQKQKRKVFRGVKRG